MTDLQKEYLQKCSDFYKKELTENIMPFWLEHGLDRENGGVYTCVDRDGYLHRDGTVAQPAKGNLFKGPFHIPRMLTIAHLLCNRILEGK